MLVSQYLKTFLYRVTHPLGGVKSEIVSSAQKDNEDNEDKSRYTL